MQGHETHPSTGGTSLVIYRLEACQVLALVKHGSSYHQAMPICPLPAAPRALRWSSLLSLPSLVLVAVAFPASADDPPFDAVKLSVRGRPSQVWPVQLSPSCPADALDLLVLSVDGAPPNENRRATIIPCRPGPGEPTAEPIELTIDPDVAALDVYDVDGAPGGELILLGRRGVRIISPHGLAEPRELEVAGGLPFPARARGISRMPVAGNWNGDGRPVALLPTVDGGLLLDLQSGATRRLELPLIAQYRTWDPDLPGRVRKLMISEFHWPVLVTGDDNGDGRTDLFALTRWDISIFHGSDEGLPSQPSRRIVLQPFDEKAEMRFEATDITYFAADLNGDSLTDLMLHRIEGGLTDGRTVTDIYVNRGDGASGTGKPDVRMELSNGLSGVEPLDLDGDGRFEIIETSFQFGVLQVVRVLLTRKTSVQVRIRNIDPDDPEKIETSWEKDLTFKINFGAGRIDGLFPNADGDWNGDGIKDLILPTGSQKIAIRLGERGKKGPRFGNQVAEQKVEVTAGRTRVADLDGDGLPDLVAYDPRDAEGTVWVLYNRGNLPGTRPELRTAASRR